MTTEVEPVGFASKPDVSAERKRRPRMTARGFN